MVESEGNGRMCLTLPEVLVSVVGIEKVVPTWEDLDVFLRLLPRSSTGERMNPYTSTWTGVTPGDGPQEVVVVLLDNGRTRALADQVGRQALRCIRCSACLNSCPVYERVGGHAYGSVYPGPDRRDPQPAAEGRRHRPADRLAALRLLAVRRLLRGLPGAHRHPLGPRRPARPGRRRPSRTACPRPQTVAMKGAAATFGSGRRLGLAERFARLGTGVAARFGASGWTGARDLPRAPRESFRAWWRRTDGGRSMTSALATRSWARSARPWPVRAPAARPPIPHGSAPDDVVALFAERVADYRAVVERCTPRQLQARLKAALPPRAGSSSPPGSRSTSRTPSSTTDCRAAELDACAAVVTDATVGIAETGTIVLDHGPGQGRRAITLVPDVHVCIVRADQVVADVPDAMPRLDPTSRSPGSAAPAPPATSSSTGSRASTAPAPCTSSLVG